MLSSSHDTTDFQSKGLSQLNPITTQGTFRTHFLKIIVFDGKPHPWGDHMWLFFQHHIKGKLQMGGNPGIEIGFIIEHLE